MRFVSNFFYIASSSEYLDARKVPDERLAASSGTLRGASNVTRTHDLLIVSFGRAVGYWFSVLFVAFTSDTLSSTPTPARDAVCFFRCEHMLPALKFSYYGTSLLWHCGSFGAVFVVF